MSKLANVRNLKEKIVFACLIGIAAFFVLRVAAPIGIDTVFLGDTTFITHLGWRGVNGLVPHVDYAHFYGGATERFVTFGFNTFGVDFKSFDYTHALVFLAVTAFIGLVTARRISGTGFAIVLLITAFVILSANDIEDGFTTWASHSFLYNHAAIGLMVGLMVFSCTKAKASSALICIAALAAGGGLYWITLLKTPFAVFAIALYGALALQRRWREILFVSIGLAATIVTVDPWFVHARGAADILFSSKAFDDSGGLIGRIERMFRTILWHAPYLAILGLLTWGYFKSIGRESFTLILSLLFMLAGYGAVSLVMAGQPDQIMVPAVIATLCILADRMAAADHRLTNLSYGAAFLLAFALTVPGLAASGHATYRGFKHADQTLIDDGPMATYLLFDTHNSMEFLNEPSAEARRAAAIAQTMPRLEEGGSRSIDPYIRLADGWAMLKDIPDIQSFGIISSRDSLDFTFTLQSRPVPSFPAWATRNSVNWVDLGDVDIIMEARFPPEDRKFNDDMQAQIDGLFRVCRTSQLFFMKTKVADNRIACD